ncbi:helix-turn-helix domain-containing protein [Myxococcota bacterium]|nr:helix-turn-helix domain-containing protein [Myxococcota bacterium]
MYDVRLALNDMARQLRACRAQDGLTLQQLATRCGVAASTIHKIEAQQMVPTVSVLLKIARGLGRRPEELVRDRVREEAFGSGEGWRPGDEGLREEDESLLGERSGGAWRVDFARGEQLDAVPLSPGQRAILFIERGRGELSSPRPGTRVEAGDCLEIEGEPFGLMSEPTDPVALLLIVSPIGRLGDALGPPNAAPRPRPRRARALVQGTCTAPSR